MRVKDTNQGCFLLHLSLLPEERAGSVQSVSLRRTSKVCVRMKSRLKPGSVTLCGKCCTEIFVSCFTAIVRGAVLKKLEISSLTVLVCKVSFFNNTFFSVFRNSQYRNQSENLQREFGEWLSPFNSYWLIYSKCVIKVCSIHNLKKWKRKSRSYICKSYSFGLFMLFSDYFLFVSRSPLFQLQMYY